MGDLSKRIARALTDLRGKLPQTDPSAVWLLLGDTLSELEMIVPQSPDGRPWTELDQIGLDRVGVLRLTKDDWELVRQPSLTPPNPDRRYLLNPDPGGPNEPAFP